MATPVHMEWMRRTKEETRVQKNFLLIPKMTNILEIYKNIRSM